ILRALRGQDSLILTTSGMVDRVAVRVEAYCNESGNTIRVIPLNTTNPTPVPDPVDEEARQNDPL
ncbi:MAG: ABC transporter ATP-binding protein, partial [Methanoregula sp.]|nr:ABC transporter ATP-binding protein [Methanoregula sp.]